MKKSLIMKIPTIVLFLAGCSESPVLPTESQIVVQAFLYENEAVTEVYVGRSRFLGSTDTTNEPVSNAVVTLHKNGTSYMLSSDPLRSGFYYYAGTDLSVSAGDQFSLTVTADGKNVTAETVVPVKPNSVSITHTTVVFTTDTISTPFGTIERAVMSDTVYIQWSNPADDLHYISVKSVDPNRTKISSDTLAVRMIGGIFISQPTKGSYYRQNERELEYTGKYIATVYRVNKEYADLYLSRERDSRDLTEPVTNIKNGLGVFSAFASDTVSFVVTKE